MATNSSDFYNTIANVPDSLTETLLVDYTPQVMQEDLDRGYMIRYFARQTNHPDGFITEVIQADYMSLKLNHFYLVVSLQWRITGSLDDVPGPQSVNTPTRLFTGILTANRLAIVEAEKTLPGLSLRLRNLSSYYVFG